MMEFNSLDQLGNHFLKLAAMGEEVIHLSADKCGQIVENSAKAEIGFYQPERGPFVEWEELADSTEAEKARKGYMIEAPLFRTGQEIRDKISRTTDGGTSVVGCTSKLMEYHEFGTLHIPPRPVMGPALYMNIDRITIGLSKVAVAWVGGYSWKRQPITLK